MSISGSCPPPSRHVLGYVPVAVDADPPVLALCRRSVATDWAVGQVGE